MQTLNRSPDPALPRPGRHKGKENKILKKKLKRNNHIVGAKVDLQTQRANTRFKR